MHIPSFKLRKKGFINQSAIGIYGVQTEIICTPKKQEQPPEFQNSVGCSASLRNFFYFVFTVFFLLHVL